MEHTPQEYADFLNKTIVCFNLKNGTYEYRAIDNDCKPFVMAWNHYFSIINDSLDPEKFYKDYRWKLTKTLAVEKYDSYFKLDSTGNIRYLNKTDSGFHYFEKGKIYTFSEAENLNFIVNKWDKNIYKPNSNISNDEFSKDIEVTDSGESIEV